MYYNFNYKCSKCRKDSCCHRSSVPPKGHLCGACQYKKHLKEEDNRIKNKKVLKETYTKQPTGWNPNEKTFLEYCGPDNFQHNHEILDSVPLSRADKRDVERIMYSTTCEKPK